MGSASKRHPVHTVEEQLQNNYIRMMQNRCGKEPLAILMYKILQVKKILHENFDCLNSFIFPHV